MSLYHARVDTDGDGTLYTIVESSNRPAHAIDHATKETMLFYAVRYAEGAYDIVRVSGGEITSMGLRDNNRFVGEPKIEIALRSARGLPHIILFSDVIIAHIPTPAGIQVARIHLYPWTGKTWKNDSIVEAFQRIKLIS